MTHEELLQKISDNTDNCLGIYAGAVLGDALRAVVELHKPSKNSDMSEFADDDIGCGGCGFDFNYLIWENKYPCPTIQTIEKELK